MLDIRPDDAKVKEMIDSVASQYQDPDQVRSYYYANEQQLNQIQNIVLEEQIVDFVLESAVVTDKAVSYEEAVSREPASSAAADEDDSAENA